MRQFFRVLPSVILLFYLNTPSTNVEALPTQSLSALLGDTTNASLLGMIDQDQQPNLKDVDDNLPNELLGHANYKDLATQAKEQLSDLGNSYSSILGSTSTEPMTVVIGTGPKIVLESMGTTKTIFVPLPSSSPPYLPTTKGTEVPVTVLMGTGSRVVLASMGTTETVEVSGAPATVTVTVVSSMVAPTSVTTGATRQ